MGGGGCNNESHGGVVGNHEEASKPSPPAPPIRESARKPRKSRWVERGIGGRIKEQQQPGRGKDQDKISKGAQKEEGVGRILTQECRLRVMFMSTKMKTGESRKDISG